MASRPFTTAEIREAFLRFFETKHAHKRLPSASLIPANNPTVLLTPAGMLPFVPIFLGVEPAPNPPRATTAQKCARVSGKASDLEAVGRTPRHHTFFEMMGNFSFGDYFKHDIIPWAWDFLTEELGLEKDRLWVSVFREDDESYAIWRDVVGVSEERLFRCDEKDNFWGPPGPTGPCGPCSELHYDLTQNPEDDLDTRLIEIWNLVFMESFKDADGKVSPLEKKNVDTGAGLERLAMVVQGVANTFETDILKTLVNAVSQKAGVAYGASVAGDVALKIIADHLRFIAFAITDGAIPSNEGRGYVVRMILRRAVRYGRQYLGFQAPFLHELLPVVQTAYQAAYPELNARFASLQETVRREEERFLETLDKGSRHLQDRIDALAAAGQTTLDGQEAFRLYDTYGFPVELTKDVLQEAGLLLDEAGFEAAMEEAKRLARSGRKQEAIVGDQLFSELMSQGGATEFVGYDQLSSDATVLALLVDGVSVECVEGCNQPFQVVLNKTPFYAESGGQQGDKGFLSADAGEESITVLITDTQKVGTLVVHHALYDQGAGIRVGDTLTAYVNEEHRLATARHHSATHLVHAALKQVLGSEVGQAGSQVGPAAARFDFTFHRAVSVDELNRMEALVNRWVFEGLPQETRLMPIEDAKASGAVAMFGEKYGDSVRVVSFGSASLELCGGTHVNSVSEIGLVRLCGEQAVASGVRRLEFVAGWEAYRQFRQNDGLLKQVQGSLKALPAEVVPRIEKLQDDLKAREKQLVQLKAQLVLGEKPRLLAAAQAAGGDRIVSAILPASDSEALKTLGEAVMNEAKQQGLDLALVLATEAEGKVFFLCWVSDALVKTKQWKAGEIVKQLASQCGGGGGGKPTFAQAGGKDASQLVAAMASLG